MPHGMSSGKVRKPSIEGVESIMTSPNRVDANGKVEALEELVALRLCGSTHIDVGVRNGDCGSGNSRSGRIENSSIERAQCCLTPRYNREQTQTGEHQQQQTLSHRFLQNFDSTRLQQHCFVTCRLNSHPMFTSPNQQEVTIEPKSSKSKLRTSRKGSRRLRCSKLKV